ncbi:hypothetical protein EDD86DRAFT_260578 [Gorgonomyces haynaldii]|nr:hypothetical protein EDD86DRAFT_250670 [Gorgonomyces haynaldii]KAI8903714.1 hypothetical protein EDD86DRAFT_260578 [Gorgonomyces haynaldii]
MLLGIFHSLLASPNIPVFTAQWENNTMCGAPPDAVYFFNVSDLSGYFNDVDESWSTVYSYVWLDSCGSLPLSLLDLGCCWSFTNASVAGGFKSGMGHVLSKPNDLTRLPAVANGASYCALTTDVKGALWGYTGMYVKATGDCVEGYLRCSPTGDLSIYYYNGTLGTDPGCQGDPAEVISMSRDQQEYVSEYLDRINITLLDLKDGTMKNDWYHYYPTTKIYWSGGFETFAELCYITAILCAYAFGGYLLYELYLIQKKMFWSTVNIVSMFVLGTVVLINYWLYLNANYFLNISGENLQSYQKLVLFIILQVCVSIFFSLCTLALVLLTYSTIVMPLLWVSSSDRVRYAGGVIVFLIYCALDGSRYVDIAYVAINAAFLYSRLDGPMYYFTPEQDQMNQKLLQLGKLMDRWNVVLPYWILFMFLFNLVPPILVAMHFVQMKAKSKRDQIYLLQKADPWFFPRVGMQLFVSTMYFVLLGIGIFSAGYKDDRNYSASTGPMQLCLVLHMVLTIFITNVMKAAAMLPNSLLTHSHHSSGAVLNKIGQSKKSASVMDQSTHHTHQSTGTVE